MLENFFQDVQVRREQQLMQGRGKWPRNNPVASDISRCARETALGVLHWEDRPEFGIDLVARLEAGTDQEHLAYSKMARLGIPILESARVFELKDAKGRLLTRGKIDGKLNVPGRKRPVPFDLKTMHPNLFDRMNTVEDFLAHQFFAKYPKQLMLYEYMDNSDIGFLWVDNMMGKWKFIEVPMMWNLMEGVLRQLETAVDAIEKIKAGANEEAALPPFHGNPAECTKCWAFKRVCTPPFTFGEGLRVVNDPEFADDIARLKQLDAAATEYDLLDKKIKESLKKAMKGGDNWIVGDFLVTAEEKSRNMKAQAAKEASVQTYLSFSIEPLDEDQAVRKSTEDYEAM